MLRKITELKGHAEPAFIGLNFGPFTEHAWKALIDRGDAIERLRVEAAIFGPVPFEPEAKLSPEAARKLIAQISDASPHVRVAAARAVPLDAGDDVLKALVSLLGDSYSAYRRIGPGDPAPESMIADLVLMKLDAVGLRGARDLFPEECSGGMQRRIAFARAVALDPMLVMYDEPFTGQDPMNLGVLSRLVRKLNDALGTTSVIVSHDVAETLDISDYVYLISDGRIAAQGTPEQIRASGEGSIRQFLRGEADGPVPFHYPAAPIASLLEAGAR